MALRRPARQLVTAAAVALTALTAVSFVAGVHAAAGSAASPSASASVSSEAALWRRQDRLSDLREWITALPGIQAGGYITNINDPDAGSTIVVWHGPPDGVQRQILAEAHRRHIPVSVQLRNHSRADLERAADQLITIAPGTGPFENFEVSTVGTVDIDVDGVTVTGEYRRPPAEGVPAADAALARTLTATTGVAVAVEHGRLEPL